MKKLVNKDGIPLRSTRASARPKQARLRVLKERWDLKRKISCDDCGNFPQCPMLKDEIWNTISHKKGLLCVSCAEKKLGREIEKDDLENCPANYFTKLMIDRIIKNVHSEMRL